MKRLIALMLCLLMLGLAACAEQKLPPSEDSAGVMVAVFAGMADGHTIEVYVNDKPVTLQLEGDALTQAEGFEEGDEVYIRYEQRDGVMYALTIELAPPAQ